MRPDPSDPVTELTLGQVLRRTARRWPDQPALLSDERRYTWAELDAEVDRVAAVLQSAGVQPGDVLGFMITKRPAVVTAFLACARIGAVVAPVNFKLHADHLRDQFQTAHIQAVLTESAFDSILRGLLVLLPDPNKVIYVDGPGRHGLGVLDLPADGPLVPFPATPDTVCYLNYTSGTTGRPKGALTTHRNIIENAVATIESLDFRDDDCFLGMFSVFAHPHELFHRSLINGAPFVVVDTLSPRIVMRAIERFGVRWMMAVPSFYEMMLDHLSLGGPAADISSLRVLESGGAYVGAETLARMESSFDAMFVPVWGCTEATGGALANGPGTGRRPGTTGRPVAGYQAQVVDERGALVPEGEVGELLLRGPAMVQAYIGGDDSDPFARGWYRTRDLVRRLDDGFLQFIARRSEMLKIGGIRVYPLEIERVLSEHPDVREVVVVRAEERLRGEVARAVVRTAEGSGLSSRSARAYCRERLAVYKVPRVVEFWRQIPHLPNGKVDKRAIVAVPMDADRDER